MKRHSKSECGQIILILLMVMTVALGIGLTIITRTLTDVSTSTKVEQSSRAFSAAEAGIEQVLKTNTAGTVPFANQSQADIKPPIDLPQPGQGLEYPPVGKEEIAHFWLADPKANLPACASPFVCYNQTTLDVYWGSPNSDKAAIEITITYYDSAGSAPCSQPCFKQTKYFYDSDPTRISANGFLSPPTPCSSSVQVNTSFGSGRQFYCKVTLSGLPSGLMILRARLLYTNVTQPIAVIPTGGASLPFQAKVYTSIGTSGNTQRTVQLFSLDKVVPFYLDYAIFSTGPISK